MRRIASLALACLVGLLVFARAPVASADVVVGRAAPEIHVAQGYRGVEAGATLADFHGHPLVIKLFFSDCPHCRASFGEFESLHRRYASRGVRFLAIAYESWGSLDAYARTTGTTFAIGLDPSGVTASRYGVSSFPANFVIDGEGVVRAVADLSVGTIERVAAAAGPSPAERNVLELGEVPTSLAAVRPAARDNDYGLVLRIVEPHLDPARDGPDVVAAARRIQAIAKVRYGRRTERLERLFASGERSRAVAAAQGVVADFRGTSLEAAAVAWSRALSERLNPAASLPAGHTP